jgi:hypothetical protein
LEAADFRDGSDFRDRPDFRIGPGISRPRIGRLTQPAFPGWSNRRARFY